MLYYLRLRDVIGDTVDTTGANDMSQVRVTNAGLAQRRQQRLCKPPWKLHRGFESLTRLQFADQDIRLGEQYRNDLRGDDENGTSLRSRNRAHVLSRGVVMGSWQ